MPVGLLWLELAATASVILVASNFLVKSADVIAFKTGLGRTFVGVVLLATATSLPELATGLSSILVVDEPDLAAGNALGANLVNLLIIGLLDLMWRNGPLLNAVGMTSVLMAALGIAITGVVVMAVFVHDATSFASGWYVSPFSIALLVLFASAIFLIYRRESAQQDDDQAEPESGLYEDSSLPRTVAGYLASAAVIITAGVVLSKIGDGLADAMNWEASFVGTQFLAISTTLPELATSIAAIRLRAPELALANLLGSNIFNHGAVLFLDDVAYTDGVLWEQVSQINLLTGLTAIAMTCVVIVGLLARGRRRPGRFWTFEAVALFALYGTTSALVFTLA